jgi:hypothetical protein
MAVIKREVPKETTRAYEEGLDLFVDKSDIRARRLRKASRQGIPVYSLTLRDVLNHEGTETAAPAGWRILTQDSEAGVAAADLRVYGDATQRLTCLSRDPSLRRLIDTLHEIPNLPELEGEKEYEVRLLIISGALTEAFWLKSSRDKRDFVVPVFTPSSEMEVGRAYPVEQFLELAEPLARRYLDFDRTAD